MDRQDLIERLKAGEDSGHQFKANFNSIDQLAVEIAAFANSQGGSILVGADEMPTEVPITKLDLIWFARYYQTVFGEDLNEAAMPRETLLENLKLARDGNLTLAGLLLFGQNVGWHRPQFGIKGTVYLTPDEFRDKEDIDGNLFSQHQRGVDFILRNLHRRPQNRDFNAPGECACFTCRGS